MIVRLATTDEQRAAAFVVRHEVFVAEQGVPDELEVDALDASCDHFVLYDGQRALGAGRLVVEPPGFAGSDPRHGPVGHLGRLVVRASARGRGHGAQLVAAIERRAQELGMHWVVLSAQLPAIPFYEKLGYHAYGSEFDDAGLAHRWMHKAL